MYSYKPPKPIEKQYSEKNKGRCSLKPLIPNSWLFVGKGDGGEDHANTSARAREEAAAMFVRNSYAFDRLVMQPKLVGDHLAFQ